MKSVLNESSPISVEAALEAILEKIHPVEIEPISLVHGLGRVLAQAIISQVNVPPFTNSAMDGYAIIAADSQGATGQTPIRLQVIDNIPAGATPARNIVAQTAARIMTGAPLPQGADAVIRFEETSEYVRARGLSESEVLLYARVQPGENVRQAGEDIKIGQTLL